MSKSQKREGPDPVAPVTIGGTRFEAIHWSNELGVEQNGGYIAAFDDATGKLLWTLRVYETVYDPERERDVQDVFITRITAGEPEGKLRVTSEDERDYLVDPDTRTVVEA